MPSRLPDRPTSTRAPPSPPPCRRYNLAHRGYNSECRGHAACPFDFYKTWAAAPEKTRALSEALTRDAGESGCSRTLMHAEEPRRS